MHILFIKYIFIIMFEHNKHFKIFIKKQKTRAALEFFEK